MVDLLLPGYQSVETTVDLVYHWYYLTLFPRIIFCMFVEDEYPCCCWFLVRFLLHIFPLLSIIANIRIIIIHYQHLSATLPLPIIPIMADDEPHHYQP